MKTLNLSIGFFKAFVVIYVCMFLSGCFIADVWLGMDKEAVDKQIDTNKDGKISEEEAKASRFDVNKDGKIDEKEYKKAEEGSEAPTEIFQLLALLNVPFAGAAALGLTKFKKYKQHARALVGGIEDLINLKEDGFTKEDIYEAQRISAKYRTNAKALGKFVEEVKGEMRIKNQHLPEGSSRKRETPET